MQYIKFHLIIRILLILTSMIFLWAFQTDTTAIAECTCAILCHKTEDKAGSLVPIQ